MLKLRTLFSGIGAPESALDRMGINYEVLDFCEIDKYAAKSYCAVHGVPEDKNLGDVTKVWGRNLPYANLMVWGFPCQDISNAGKQKGIQEGETRSGLYYEGLRILKETTPKYSVIENVKALTGKKFKEDFNSMLEDIESIGYNNYWKVLNAKDYGIPQNRERVFIVSIRKDVDDGKFEFPKGFENGRKMSDYLVNDIDAKWLKDESYKKLLAHNKRHKELGHGFKARIFTKEETRKAICPTVYTVAHRGDSTYINDGERIRTLQPQEAWRLMGFSDNEFWNAQLAGVSNAQLYKQAGNSIVVDVLVCIFNNLLKKEIAIDNLEAM